MPPCVSWNGRIGGRGGGELGPTRRVTCRQYDSFPTELYTSAARTTHTCLAPDHGGSTGLSAKSVTGCTASRLRCATWSDQQMLRRLWPTVRWAVTQNMAMAHACTRVFRRRNGASGRLAEGVRDGFLQRQRASLRPQRVEGGSGEVGPRHGDLLLIQRTVGRKVDHHSCRLTQRLGRAP